MPAPPIPPRPPGRADVLAALLLLATTLVVFLPVCQFDFINYDDGFYVTENPDVQAGLSADSFRWAWTARNGFWHPLTWLSLQVDCEIHGLDAHGFHATNLLLHLANTLLVFLVLRQLTGSVWRSFLVAALFALHPLHVETVAWVSERKGLLSTFFALLTLIAYGQYAARPGVGRYLTVVVAFVLGLMAKPTLVLLPAALLLLDYWPLRRLPGKASSRLRTCARLLAEKLPLGALAVVASVVTLMAEQKVGAVPAQPPLAERLGAAFVHLEQYLSKTVWPRGLIVPYARLNETWTWPVAVATAILVFGVTALAWRLRRRPYLVVGWLWFVGMLLPVLGLVQIGSHGLADRYTYLPHIGLFVGMVWGAYDLFAGRTRMALAVTSVVLVLTCAALSSGQVWQWRDSATLWRHTLAVAPDNPIAHANLGVLIYHEGKLDEAANHYREALRVQPDHWIAHDGLGQVLLDQGRIADAQHEFEAAVAANPDRASPYENLGALLERQGRTTDAQRCYAEGARVEPNSPASANRLGLDLLRRGQPEAAEAQFAVAVRRLPRVAELHGNLGAALFNQGRLAEAVIEFREAVRLNPVYVGGRLRLGTTLQRQGDFAGAGEQYAAVLILRPNLAEAHDALGSLREEQGQCEEAVARYRRAADLVPGAVKYHCDLASALWEVGRGDEAQAEFAAAFHLEPNWPVMVERMARELRNHPDPRRRWPALADHMERQVRHASDASNPAVSRIP